MRVLRPLVLSLLLVLGGGITALSAQNREVSGKVLDANQQPLVGVAVLVDGTTKGVTTSENGTFKIQVPSGEAVLQVTCLGYLPQKVTVPSSRNSITIYLQEDAIMLDATVVIGYGTQKKVNLTGAVATVGSKELENRVTHSLGSMLQGSVAGLNITTSSGKPGSTPAINIRGVNSINSADPLVLIDGVVGDLNRVNPNDVESISVIKDASAAAVYGARAAFGVILVTTKNGSAQDGKATVRYSGRFGWEEATTSTDYENRGYWSVYTVNKFWQAGDLKFVDLDGNGVWGVGNDTVDKPGDRTILGNSLPTLSYGINASIRWMGFDASVFFQGTGNHYWYPHGEMMPFWGCYSYPYLSYLPTDFLGKVWAEDNPNSYFPRARAYSSSGGYLSKVNDRYLQNIRYLRLKNLTVGYTIPATLTKKAGIDQIRIYFSGENLCYWSPLKKNSKYVDPEAAINRSGVNNNAYYPWAKTFMFGIDITF